MQITWNHILNAIAVTADHMSKNLCIRPKPNVVPVKMCVRKSTDGFCCTRHKNECPTLQK